jgi:glycosyltransferase involved in cell wall biosynthesis
MIFLEAAKAIHSEFPETKFYLLGEGTLVHVIRDFINNNSLSNVIDFRFHNNPPDVFAHTSVFVTLQSNTNYPSQSVLEAMASGNAIIASDVGDTNLFINESNGILIDLQTSNLATALKKLITTPELAVKMGKRGREAVLKDHKIEKMANYYLELIERACKKL